jgi:hypothetical protein
LYLGHGTHGVLSFRAAVPDYNACDDTWTMVGYSDGPFTIGPEIFYNMTTTMVVSRKSGLSSGLNYYVDGTIDGVVCLLSVECLLLSVYC